MAERSGDWMRQAVADLRQLARSDVPIRDRIASLMPAAFPVGMDLFPLTDEETADRRGSPLIEAVGRGRWRSSRR